MNLRTLAVVVLVGALSSLITYALVGGAEELQRPTSETDSSPQTPQTGEVVERLDLLIELLKSSHDLRQSVVTERVEDHSSEWRDALERLERVEASLLEIVRNLDEARVSSTGVAPAPHAKNERLVAEVSEQGRKTPRSNGDRFWAWTPREVYEQFGRPDFTTWDKETGCLDWGYWGPDLGAPNRYIIDGGAIQFRFEAGLVKDVWP